MDKTKTKTEEKKKFASKEEVEKMLTKDLELFRKPLRVTGKVMDKEVEISRDKIVLDVIKKDKITKYYEYADQKELRETQMKHAFLLDSIRGMCKSIKDHNKGTLDIKVKLTTPTQSGDMKVFVYMREAGKDEKLMYSDGCTVKFPKKERSIVEGESYLLGRLMMQMWQVFVQALINYKNMAAKQEAEKVEKEKDAPLKKV